MDAPGDRLLRWCLTVGYAHQEPGALVSGFVRAAQDSGVPIDRLMLTLRTLHPQLAAVGWSWEGDAFTEARYRRAGRDSAPYRSSPVRPILEGEATQIRVALRGDAADRFPITRELADRGYTDYLALALAGSDGSPNLLSLATRAPGGFSDHHLAVLSDGIIGLRAVVSRHQVRMIAENICTTYIGPYTGLRVLRGEIERGAIERLRAAVWFSDIRQFTAQAQALGTTKTVALLNTYFGVIGDAVEASGGEILKFIGDAALAVFPVVGCGDQDACDRALAAAHRARQDMAAASDLRFGVGLHLGELAYGNIGARQRLDFTVIGSTVNLASRLESLCGALGAPLLTSARFAAACSAPLVSLGTHAVKGVAEPVEVFQPT